MGFSPPEYTMVPNPLFDEFLPRLTHAQLKVLLFIFRQTLGWYQQDRQIMSLRKIAQATGLSVHHTFNAGCDLEKMGLIAKSTKPGQETEWRILFELKDNSNSPTGERFNSPTGERGFHPATGKSRVKEIKEIEIKKIAADAAPPENPERKKDLVDAYLDFQKPTETLIHAVETAFCLNVNWRTKTARQWLEWAHAEEITPDQIRKAAQVWKDDKQFNWARPSLPKIFEHWPVLVPKEGNNSMTIEQRVDAMLAKSRAGLPYATGGK